MASWTPLNTASTYTQVSLELWNNLSSSNGNLQYLYDIINRYGFEDYYAYGTNVQTSFSFIMLLTPSSFVYDFAPTSFVDERPSGIEAQFYDEEDYSNIKVQKSGLYLLNVQAFAVNDINNNPTATTQITFFNNEEEFSSISNSMTAGGSTLAQRGLTPNPVEHFEIKRFDKGSVFNATLLALNSDSDVLSYNGNVTNDYAFARGPYISFLFLAQPEFNFDIPSVIYFYAALSEYLPAINDSFVGKMIAERERPAVQYDEPPWRSTNQPTEIISYGMKYVDSNLWWYLHPAVGNKPSYTYPNFNSTLPIWRTINNNIDFRYFLIAIKSLDLLAQYAYESNIFEFVIYDPSLEGFKGSPCTLSVSWSGTNANFQLRTYTRVTSIIVSGLDATKEIIIGLEFEQLYNGYILYNPKLIINNKIIATQSGNANILIYGPGDEYTGSRGTVYSNSMSIVNATFIQGPDFYPITNNPIKCNVGYYGYGNWQLSDAFTLNDNAVKEKEFLWKFMSEAYQIDAVDYTVTVSESDAPNIILIGTYNFNGTGKLI
jgi:hypothetical protein